MEVLKHLPRGPADDNVSEKHVWSLLLHKHVLKLEYFGEKKIKMLRKVFFSCTNDGAERHVTRERFENAASRAKTNVILFMDGWVSVLRPFNSISVISRRWKVEHERLCEMKRRLGSGRISPPAGILFMAWFICLFMSYKRPPF